MTNRTNTNGSSLPTLMVRLAYESNALIITLNGDVATRSANVERVCRKFSQTRDNAHEDHMDAAFSIDRKAILFIKSRIRRAGESLGPHSEHIAGLI